MAKVSLPRLLLTRARPQAEAFAADVRATTCLIPHIAPMQEMHDLPVQIDLSGVTALAFTSKNGVAAFARMSPVRLPAFCVGAATAAYAQALGFEAQAAAGNIESLRAILPETGVLHLHGRHVAGALGVPDLAIYEQVALPLDTETQALLSAGKIDTVALFSPRAARLFAAAFPKAAAKVPLFYALSDAVAAPVAHLGPCQICPVPRADAMIALLSADYPA